jgi:hypothetical protein
VKAENRVSCITSSSPTMVSSKVQRLFAFALDGLGDRESINELLEITLDERKVVHVERYDFPATK